VKTSGACTLVAAHLPYQGYLGSAGARSSTRSAPCCLWGTDGHARSRVVTYQRGRGVFVSPIACPTVTRRCSWRVADAVYHWAAVASVSGPSRRARAGDGRAHHQGQWSSAHAGRVDERAGRHKEPQRVHCSKDSGSRISPAFPCQRLRGVVSASPRILGACPGQCVPLNRTLLRTR